MLLVTAFVQISYPQHLPNKFINFLHKDLTRIYCIFDSGHRFGPITGDLGKLWSKDFARLFTIQTC